MGSTPSPPNPYAQAAAQQAAEQGAAATSAIMNNPNIYAPWGSQTYTPAGYQTVYDAQGKPTQVMRYNQNINLSPDQMRLYGLQTQAGYNLGQTAVEQSAKINKLLQSNVDTQGLQGWSAGAAPGQMTGTFANVGGPQRQLGGAGAIQRGFADVGGPQRSFAGGGNIRQDQGPTNRAAIEAAMMGRFNTDQAQQARAQDAQLAARGMAPGSEQAGFVQNQRDRSRTDATQQAYLASGAESRAAQEAYNQAQQQRFGQNAQQAQFGNQAQQQAYEQAMGRAGFANQAQQQQFGQMAAQGQFANAAQQQAYEQALNRAQFGNQAVQGNYQMGQDYASFLNNLRAGQLQERVALRNQPINEITALMGGSQVQMPNFAGFTGQGVNAAPIGGYMGQNYASRANAAAQQNAGMFGMFGAGLQGLLMPGGFFG